MTSSSKTANFGFGLAIAAVAVAARWPAFRSWWCLDDWGQLARAAGIAEPLAGVPARWLSQHLWWQVVWPVLGLAATPHTALRIALHAAAAVLVFRIGRRAGLTAAGAWPAGLLFAATPVAFTPVFWASGIQELLAGVLALAALERWLGTGRRAVLAAVVCGVGSILAKESGLGLPLLLGGLLGLGGGGMRPDRRWRVAAVAALAVLAAGESVLVLRQFATGQDDPYATGGALTWLVNLGKFGLCLLTPGPVFASRLTIPAVVTGWVLFAAWTIWGAVAWRRGRRLPLAALAAALLSLAPALPLKNQAHPYLAYLAAAAFYLALAELLPRTWRPRTWLPRRVVAALLVVLAAGWGYWTMQSRLERQAAAGLPADPVVRAAHLSQEAGRVIYALRGRGGAGAAGPLVILQPPINEAEAARAQAAGPWQVTASPRYAALGGSRGPALIAGLGGAGGAEAAVRWANSLVEADSRAIILCETGNGLVVWGDCWTGLMYAALTDAVLGHHQRAAGHLGRALELDDDPRRFTFDPRRSPVSAPQLERRLPGLLVFLEGQVRSGALAPAEATRLRAAFLHLAREVGRR